MVEQKEIIQSGYNKNTKHYNTDEWRQSALHFDEFGRYTNLPPNSHPSSRYYKFWEEEARRSVYGYNIGRDWIPGYFYWYLNYCPIYKAIEIPGQNGEVVVNIDPYDIDKIYQQAQADRIFEFPDFWDGDYETYHYYEEAERAGEHGVVLKTRGRGYQQPNSEPVLTPDGFKTMGDLVAGDLVIGSNGDSTIIKEIIPQGNCDVYEIEFHDSRKVKCGLEHLWGVYNTKGKYSVVTTEYLLNNNLKQHPGTDKSSYSYKVPSISPVEFDKRKYNIDPYLLGLLIGDGGISGSQIKFSTADTEILFYMNFILGSNYNLNKDKWTDYGYIVTSKIKGYHKLMRDIKDLKLNVKSYDKFIPDQYKYGSVEQRFELVKGLMDTDGTVNENGNARFTSSSEVLIDDLAWVLRSLGIRCNKAKTNLGGKLTDFGNGHKSIVRDTWILSITSYYQIFKLQRKAKKLDRAITKRKQKNQDRIGIKAITKLDYKEESTCIYIDSDDHLYLTTDFIPTHNSFKGGSMLDRNYYLIPGSNSFVFADDKAYLIEDGLLTKAWEMMDHIEQNTPWGKRRDRHDAIMHKKASYYATTNGLKIEKGFKSDIIGISLKNNWNKARGKRGKLLLFEEAGKFPNLLNAWNISLKSMQQGRLTFGLQIAFGTGGTEGEDFIGLEQLFYEGGAWNVHMIKNKWDDGAGNAKCAHFVSTKYNMEGAMDEYGNSLVDVSGKIIDLQREKVISNTKNAEAIIRHIAEEPITPQEAVMRIAGTIYPIIDLKNHRNNILANPEKYEQLEYVGNLIINEDNENIEWKPDSKVHPIRKYPELDKKIIEGGLVIYEHPVAGTDGLIPYGVYIAGNDPYDHDESTTDSLGSTFIMNKLTERIVAEYTGRPATANQYYEIVRRMLIYYNARCNYENNWKGLFTYLNNKHFAHLLTDTPKLVADKIYDKSVLNRGKGTPGTTPIKKWGRELILMWLTTPVTLGSEKLNLHTINSIPLLQELIYWHDKGNFDRHDALAMLLILKEDVQHIGTEEYESGSSLSPFFARMEMFQEKMKQKNDPFESISQQSKMLRKSEQN